MRCAMRKTIKSEKLNNCMTASRDGTSRICLRSCATTISSKAAFPPRTRLSQIRSLLFPARLHGQRRFLRVRGIERRDTHRVTGMLVILDDGYSATCGERSRVGSFQEVGNVHRYRAGRTIDSARHAVPTFIVRHVGFLCEVADAQHIERAHVDANGASFVRDAFVVVDDNWNCRGSLRQWHACCLRRVRGDSRYQKIRDRRPGRELMEQAPGVDATRVAIRKGDVNRIKADRRYGYDLKIGVGFKMWVIHASAACVCRRAIAPKLTRVEKIVLS